MTTLADRLQDKLSPLNIDDPLWVTFVHDYKHRIIAESNSVLITGADVDRFDFKWPHFFETNGCDPRIIWIALAINDIDVYQPMRDMQEVYVPDIIKINELYRKYVTAYNLS